MKIDCLFVSDALSKRHYNHLLTATNFSYYKEFNKPLFVNFNSINDAALISLSSFPEDFIAKTGILVARQQFLHALKYAAEELKVKFVLLAASTKRLFGKEMELKVNWNGKLDNSGFTLNELFPNIFFTNGDNGTSVILDMEIAYNIKKITTNNSKSHVVINGLGLLGLSALEYLKSINFPDDQIIVISNYTKDLKEVIDGREIKLYTNMKLIDREIAHSIKLIINCTHHPASLIDLETITHIQNGQSIHVIDVAVPYGFPEEEYNKCSNVTRQDGGNAYIKEGLQFFFNPAICGLTDNVLYGCFAETMCLSAYLNENPDKEDFLRSFDYFNVNPTTKAFVKELFVKYGVGISDKPYNYMKREE